MTVVRRSKRRQGCRLGVAATRKLGSAVVRNRAKRLARELFGDKSETGRPGLDVILVPRREMLDAPFASLEADYTHALDQCHARPVSRGRGGNRRPRSRTP